MKACVCVKKTYRFSAKGNHSPETFITHYPERGMDGDKEDKKGGKKEEDKKERAVHTERTEQKKIYINKTFLEVIVTHFGFHHILNMAIKCSHVRLYFSSIILNIYNWSKG